MAAKPDTLRLRANELRSLGLSAVRAFRVLRKEFPHAERDRLVNAAGLPGAHRGVNPKWTEHGRALRPAQIRYQQKGGARPQPRAEVTTIEREWMTTADLLGDELVELLDGSPVLDVQEILKGE